MQPQRTLHLPTDPTAFQAAQTALAAQLAIVPGPRDPALVAAVDVAYSKTGPDTAFAVAILMHTATLEVVEVATWSGPPAHGYVPGIFALREADCLIRALQKLRGTPEVLFVDGQGTAHPRGFGLACQLGLTFDLPTVGVAKRRLYGVHDMPDAPAGSFADLLDNGHRIGAVLRTQDGIKPIYVSPGHRCDVHTAVALVMQVRSPYRIIAPIREADLKTREFREGRL